jgi:hypothetical protein
MRSADSIKRKIAHLRESVIATLETLLARRPEGRTGGEAKIDATTALSFLTSPTQQSSAGGSDRCIGGRTGGRL